MFSPDDSTYVVPKSLRTESTIRVASRKLPYQLSPTQTEARRVFAQSIRIVGRLLLALGAETIADGGAFRSLLPSLYTRTQARVIEKFLGPRTQMLDLGDAKPRVSAGRQLFFGIDISILDDASMISTRRCALLAIEERLDPRLLAR